MRPPGADHGIKKPLSVERVVCDDDLLNLVFANQAGKVGNLAEHRRVVCPVVIRIAASDRADKPIAERTGRAKLINYSTCLIPGSHNECRNEIYISLADLRLYQP